MIPYLSNQVKESGTIVALELSEKMFCISKKKHPLHTFPNIEFIINDVNKHQLEEEFDVILCYSCVPHFLNQNLTIKRLAKGLKIGGKLLMGHSQSL